MDERKLRIEVGYGLEGVITDIEAKDIIDDIIVPAFKEEQYGPGIYNGVVAIANTIYEDEKLSPYKLVKIEEKVPFTETWGFPFIIIFVNVAPWLVIGLVFLSISLKSFLREHKCPNCKKIGLIVKRRWLVYPTKEYTGRQEITAICRYCGYHELNTVTVPKKTRSANSSSFSSSFDSGSSDNSSSGSSSSSSSGFGGGSSGGGGASGSW